MGKTPAHLNIVWSKSLDNRIVNLYTYNGWALNIGENYACVSKKKNPSPLQFQLLDSPFDRPHACRFKSMENKQWLSIENPNAHFTSAIECAKFYIVRIFDKDNVWSLIYTLDTMDTMDTMDTVNTVNATNTVPNTNSASVRYLSVDSATKILTISDKPFLWEILQDWDYMEAMDTTEDSEPETFEDYLRNTILIEQHQKEIERMEQGFPQRKEKNLLETLLNCNPPSFGE